MDSRHVIFPENLNYQGDQIFIETIKQSLLIQGSEEWKLLTKTSISSGQITIYKLSGTFFPQLPGLLAVAEIDLKKVLNNEQELFNLLKTQYKQVYINLLIQYGCKPQRVWSFLPQIHQKITETETLYTLFNAARSAAFEEIEKEYRFSFQEFHSYPAATCVGTKHGSTKWILIMYGFLNSSYYTTFENPDQIPAFKYPKIYSKVPPKFSRALVSENLVCFISGTAAIKNHKSLDSKNIYQHYYTTCENITILKEHIEQYFKPKEQNFIQPFVLQHAIVYCPDKKFFKTLSDLLDNVKQTEIEPLASYYFHSVLAVPEPQKNIHYLLADVCRPELLVEIESLYTGIKVFK